MPERFVADGQERLRRSSEYRAAREAVVAVVRARYAESLAGARMFGRIMLLLRMRREIAQEVAKLAPPDALYLRAQ